MKHRPELHTKVWGEEQWIANTPLYCGKRFIVNAGRRCSLHYHKKKDETFFLESGELKLELTDLLSEGAPHLAGLKTLILRPGEAVHIPPLKVHRFTGIADAVVFEFSTQHFEDDSYRFIASG